MQTGDDRALLRQYAETRSDEAFTALAERHLGLVYAVARRAVEDSYQAEEVTQAVFLLLARNPPHLRHADALPSWLFQAARLTAGNFRRSETRRRRREQEAAMQSALNEPNNELWLKIAPLVDEAVAKLRAKDRQAILLRFYQGRSLREVGEIMGASEAAAEKRVRRALEKLRHFFARRDVNSVAAVLAGTMSSHAALAAPAGLAQTISAVALGKGAAATASTLTLMQMTMKTMTWMKLKFATGTALALLLAGGITTVALSQIANGGKSDKLTPQEIARQSQAAYAALTSYSDTGKVVFVTNETNKSETNFNITFNIRLQRPNLYRIEWTNIVANDTGIFSKIGVVWGDGSRNYMLIGLTNDIDSVEPRAMKNLKNALTSATDESYGAAGSIPSAFYKLSESLMPFNPPRGKMQRLPDEKVGAVDCRVILMSVDPVNQGVIDKTMFRLWIGKADHLIHQFKLTTGDISVRPPKDETLRETLKRQGKAITPEAITALRAQAMKTPDQMNLVIVETHENIKVNPPFTSADFAR